MSTNVKHIAVSVLVPVYNAGEYLRVCMDSLAAQTLQSIEFICLNDGSTDESLAVLQEYAAKDARFRVIDKPNSGYGATLNLGIREAHGDYIGIVEPDDFCEHTMFATLYAAAASVDADLAKSNYYEHYDDHEIVHDNLQGFPHYKAFDPVDYPRILCVVPSIWTGLYKRDFLLGQGIQLCETPGASFQDAAFTLKVWFAARKCILVEDPLYHYRMDNPGSSVKTNNKVFAVCEELAASEEFLRQRPERAAKMLPYFNLDKFGKYRWNYERINVNARLAFCQRMYEEYCGACKAGEMNFDLFDKYEQRSLHVLLDKGPEHFVASNKQTFGRSLWWRLRQR